MAYLCAHSAFVTPVSTFLPVTRSARLGRHTLRVSAKQTVRYTSRSASAKKSPAAQGPAQKYKNANAAEATSKWTSDTYFMDVLIYLLGVSTISFALTWAVIQYKIAQ